MFNGKIHYKWQFSIAMLVYLRVPSQLESLHCQVKWASFRNLYRCFHQHSWIEARRFGPGKKMFTVPLTLMIPLKIMDIFP